MLLWLSALLLQRQLLLFNVLFFSAASEYSRKFSGGTRHLLRDAAAAAGRRLPGPPPAGSSDSAARRGNAGYAVWGRDAVVTRKHSAGRDGPPPQPAPAGSLHPPSPGCSVKNPQTMCCSDTEISSQVGQGNHKIKMFWCLPDIIT